MAWDGQRVLLGLVLMGQVVTGCEQSLTHLLLNELGFVELGSPEAHQPGKEALWRRRGSNGPEDLGINVL